MRQSHRLMKAVCVLAVMMALPGLLNGSSIADRLSGRWQAQMTGDGKTFSFIFHFKTSGEAFTGTVGLSDQDRRFPIKDGEINGNSISFTAFGIWRGTLEGNDLKLTREIDYGKRQQMTAHRTGN